MFSSGLALVTSFFAGKSSLELIRLAGFVLLILVLFFTYFYIGNLKNKVEQYKEEAAVERVLRRGFQNQVLDLKEQIEKDKNAFEELNLKLELKDYGWNQILRNLESEPQTFEKTDVDKQKKYIDWLNRSNANVNRMLDSKGSRVK